MPLYGVTSNALPFAHVKPVAVAKSLYPGPTRLMLRFENVATPETAATVVVLESVVPAVPVPAGSRQHTPN